MCHQRSESIIVTESDLVRGNRVVLIDNRHHTEFQQPAEGPIRVAIVRVARYVVGGEQDLSDVKPVRVEQLRVVAHEQALTDRGSRLLGGEVTRAGLESER